MELFRAEVFTECNEWRGKPSASDREAKKNAYARIG